MKNQCSNTRTTALDAMESIHKQSGLKLENLDSEQPDSTAYFDHFTAMNINIQSESISINHEGKIVVFKETISNQSPPTFDNSLYSSTLSSFNSLAGSSSIHITEEDPSLQHGDLDSDHCSSYDSDLDSDFDPENEIDEDNDDTDLESSISDTEEDIDSPKLSELPIWWGNEEGDQLMQILSSYENALIVEGNLFENHHSTHIHHQPISTSSSHQVHSPLQGDMNKHLFVGRIVRFQVPSHNTFQTLDEVSIFYNALRPYGTKLPLQKTIWMLTTWDVESGLPVFHIKLLNRIARDIWVPVSNKQDRSSIFCEPKADHPSEFVLTVDYENGNFIREDSSIGFAFQFKCSSIPESHSTLIISSNPFNWSQFIPESAFKDESDHLTFDLGIDELNSLNLQKFYCVDQTQSPNDQPVSEIFV